MGRLLLPAGVIALVAMTFFLFNAFGQDISSGESSDNRLLFSETDGENRREIYAPGETSGIESPDLDFITSSNPYCYQPDPAEDICFINFRYTYIKSDPSPYMVYLTIKIDGELRANYRSFFDNTITVHYDMNGPGFKVSCGEPGENDEEDPDFGKKYAYHIMAEDSNALKSSNYGSLYCPPFLP